MTSEIMPSHPDVTTLRLFLLGHLAGAQRNELEGHLEHCDVCCQTALTVEDDRLVRLLRRQSTGPLGRLNEHETS
jgi:hypothetical protein